MGKIPGDMVSSFSVKLTAHRAGLPGKEVIYLLLRPFPPPTRRGLRDALPVNIKTTNVSQIPVTQRLDVTRHDGTSPLDRVPAGLRSLMDQALVQDNEPENMVTHQKNQGAEGQ